MGMKAPFPQRSGNKWEQAKLGTVSPKKPVTKGRGREVPSRSITGSSAQRGRSIWQQHHRRHRARCPGLITFPF